MFASDPGLPALSRSVVCWHEASTINRQVIAGLHGRDPCALRVALGVGLRCPARCGPYVGPITLTVPATVVRPSCFALIALALPAMVQKLRTLCCREVECSGASSSA